MEELASLNPCVKFILDNYDMLCIAHPGKAVLVVGEAVARTFDSLVEAMTYTNRIDMSSVPYAIKECNGGDPTQLLIVSNKCQPAK